MGSKERYLIQLQGLGAPVLGSHTLQQRSAADDCTSSGKQGNFREPAQDGPQKGKTRKTVGIRWGGGGLAQGLGI